jgi:hypothetical protein
VCGQRKIRRFFAYATALRDDASVGESFDFGA